jgi:hypothetical protein
VTDSLTITIGRAEALVLFDLLTHFRGDSHLLIRNDAERVTLGVVEGCLEKVLAEPFLEEYEQILEKTREKVLTRWGSPPTPLNG